MRFILLFTKDHEWLQLVEDDIYNIGITPYASAALGDIVFVELPEVGKVFSADEAIAVVESVKAASDIFAPADGIIYAVNTELQNTPELVNTDPLTTWFFKAQLSNINVDSLMTSEQYAEYAG